jgi:Uma2 family endonuclease
MQTAVTEPPAGPEPRRRSLTRVDVEALSAAGLLDQQKLELIDGELIDKMGKKTPHVASFLLLQRWLTAVFGFGFVYPEASIDVAPEDNPINEPEPDLVVLKCEVFTLDKPHPSPEDISLVIEVADTTLRFDLRVKAPLYARAGIVEYWVLDIPGRRMIVHRDPREGQYASVVAYSAEESIAPLAAPESPLRVADALMAS